MAAIPGGFSFASIGPLLQGGGSLLGGLGSFFGGGGNNNNWLAQQQFAQAQNQSWDMLNAQENFQREVGQNSIAWRVADAQRAGISPLAALGAPTFSPAVSVGSPEPNISGGGSSGRDWSSLGRMGINLGDIISKTLTDSDKADQMFKNMVRGQQLQNNELELQIKSAQLALANRRLQSPGAADVNGGDIKIVPDKVIAANRNDPTTTAGTHPQTETFRNPAGTTERSPVDPAIINNPSVTNPWVIRYLWNEWTRFVDTSITNPLRSMMGVPAYKRGE